MEKIQNLINGNLIDPIKRKFLDNRTPRTGEVYSKIPDSDEEDVALAVSAAKEAFPIWSNYSIDKRSEILTRLSQLIEDNLEALALAESKDNGKPVSLASKVDIPRAVSNFHFYGTAIKHFASESHSMGNLALNYTLREPIGIAGCISPWNLPLYLFSWKIAPALAAGNCVIAKPSEVTPMTAYLMSKLVKEAGFPDGVLNIIHGTGPKVGQAIVEHPDIPIISFTGGTATGAAISKIAAPMFKKLSLELGGKNPNIIFDDCDFEKAVNTTVKSSFANQGQICLCGSRVFIQEKIYEKFKEAFVRKTKELIVGDPQDSKTNLGAVVSESHMRKILSYMFLAEKDGGTILAGGKQVKLEGELAGGYYLQPTIIEGLAYDCKINQEEIFGPVVTITPFKTEEDVLMMANSTKYGLSATVWTENLKRAHNISKALHAGIVWVNTWLLRDLRTPFGGVKGSGVGREGGFEALHFFTEPKNVCIKLS
ncbi:MAG: aldehyde dehydrogenase [Flavobacteriales bacterium]|nr:aldehyde dehydrogenase [Flavobacteriales bacterium]